MKYKKGDSDIFVNIVFAVIVILVLAYFIFPSIRNSTNSIFGPIQKLLGFETSTTETSTKIDEWQKILNDYEKNKCEVDKYTCRVKNFGCQCFSSGLYQIKQKPETCSEDKPYCYDRLYGCSNKGPDAGYYLEACKQTNKNFELAPTCIVDQGTCEVKNVPCSCHTKGSRSNGELPFVCLNWRYCYNEQIGCSNIGPSLDKPLYIDYCQKSNKN